MPLLSTTACPSQTVIPFKSIAREFVSKVILDVFPNTVCDFFATVVL